MFRNWKLFLPNEPETHPDLNQQVLLADFRGILRKPTPAALIKRKDELFWDGGYIGPAEKPMMWRPLPRLPKNPEIREVKKCGYDGSCEYEDDGYCFDKPDEFNCSKIRIAHELKYE